MVKLVPKNDDLIQELIDDHSVIDQTDPKSVVRMLSEDIALKVMAIPESYWLMEEEDLYKHCEPNETACRLKLTFFDEYCRAQTKGEKIMISRVTKGVCTREYFYELIKKSPKNLAWIVTPPKDLHIAQRFLLEAGYRRLKEVIGMKLHKTKRTIKYGKSVKKGEIRPIQSEIIEETVDADAINAIRLTVKQIEDRVRGSVVHRVFLLKKALDVDVDGVEDNDIKDMSLDTLEALEEELKKLRAERKKEAVEQAVVVDGEVFELESGGLEDEADV